MEARQTPRCEVYGGIRTDLAFTQGLFTEMLPKIGENPNTSYSTGMLGPDLEHFGCFINDLTGFFFFTGALAIDFPLTFVGDTLTLPITIQKTLEKKRKQSSTEEVSSSQGQLK